jgi:uncharacterized spore protein YtfJ
MQNEISSPDGATLREQQGLAVLDRLLTVAEPGAVFGEPVTGGDYTVITASEVSVGLGFGYGSGGGTGPSADKAGEAIPTTKQTMVAAGYGGGGGGGGGAMARPVAVISIGPDGVRIKPVVDQTKITLALLTTLGGMLIAFRKMVKAAKR